MERRGLVPGPPPAFALGVREVGVRAVGRTARRGEGAGIGDSPRTFANRSGGLRGRVRDWCFNLDVGVAFLSDWCFNLDVGVAFLSARSSRLCAEETGGEDDAGAAGDDDFDAEDFGDANEFEPAASRSAYAVNIAGGDCAYGSGGSSSSEMSSSESATSRSGGSALSQSRTRLSSPGGEGPRRLFVRVDDRLPG